MKWIRNYLYTYGGGTRAQCRCRFSHWRGIFWQGQISNAEVLVCTLKAIYSNEGWPKFKKGTNLKLLERKWNDGETIVYPYNSRKYKEIQIQFQTNLKLNMNFIKKYRHYNLHLDKSLWFCIKKLNYKNTVGNKKWEKVWVNIKLKLYTKIILITIIFASTEI